MKRTEVGQEHSEIAFRDSLRDEVALHLDEGHLWLYIAMRFLRGVCDESACNAKGHNVSESTVNEHHDT